MKDTEAIVDYAAYIDAAAALHRLPLAPDQRTRVIKTFELATQIMSPLLECELPADVEAALVFKA
jgi:hypothetical protein